MRVLLLFFDFLLARVAFEDDEKVGDALLGLCARVDQVVGVRVAFVLQLSDFA